MDPIIIAVSVTVFFTFVALAAGLRRGSEEGGAGRMATRLEVFKEQEAAERPDDRERITLKKRTYSGLPLLASFFAQFKGSEAMAIHLERAGVPLRVGEYYLIRLISACVFFMVPFVFSQTLLTVVMALGLGVLGYMVPAIWVNGKKNKRLTRINGQLVDMLGMVSNSLKSGYGLMQSLEFASRQMDPPLATEVSRTLREANLGMGAEEALNAWGQRIDSKDLDMVLTAINIQRSVGGNLAEILDKVAHTMRERERIRGEIATLTTQQKMTGYVIGALPFFMFAIFMVINPDYMSLLITTTAGLIMLAVALGLETVGFFVIKRIISIEV
jgi:tight adherence protein B